MTKKINTLILVLATMFVTTKVSAQTTTTADIKTEIYCSHCSQCETCGQRFDTELYKLKGLKSFTIAGNTIKVSYNPKKITIDKIRECISNCGYDADDVKATEKGLSSLDGCCKKQE
jgi:mercuric ion binding protein